MQPLLFRMNQMSPSYDPADGSSCETLPDRFRYIDDPRMGTACKKYDSFCRIQAENDFILKAVRKKFRIFFNQKTIIRRLKIVFPFKPPYQPYSFIQLIDFVLYHMNGCGAFFQKRHIGNLLFPTLFRKKRISIINYSTIRIFSEFSFKKIPAHIYSLSMILFQICRQTAGMVIMSMT